MVTTRQMRKRKSDGDEVVIGSNLSSPQESQNTTPAKRQKKLPVRVKGDSRPSKETSANEVVQPDDGDSSLVVEIRAKTESDEEDLANAHSAPEPEIEEASSQGEEADDDEEAEEEEEEAEVAEDSDDAQAATVTTGKTQKLGVVPSVSEPSDSGSDSDSDDAPEAVSTTTAAAQALKSAKAANKAIAEQAKLEKLKRQERSARMEQQAKQRKEAQPQTPAGARTSGSVSSEDEDEGPMDEITPRTQLTQETNAAFSAARKRKHNEAPTKTVFSSAPSVLPAEFLDSDDDSDSGADDEASLGRKPARKARKMVTAERAVVREANKSARGRDEVVGSTLYRVAAKKRDERLAPKGDKSSMNAKKSLLARGRSGVKAKKGFFK